MEPDVRKTAIDVVGDVPWGTHFCQFYRTRAELVEVLVPYFKAGLENNEFCLWITSEPLGAEDVRSVLKKELGNLDDFIDKGQIEVLDYSQWYMRNGRFDPDKVSRSWAEKEREALERGFEGLRFTANASWLDKELWTQFTDYEAAGHEGISKYRMLGICTYSLDKCSASEIIDVVSNHQFALIRQNGDWRIIQSPAHKRAFESLRRREQQYALAQRAANIGSWDWNIETGDLHWSDRIEPLFGFASGQFGATYEAFLECVHADDRQRVVDSVNASVERGEDYCVEHRIVWPDGTVRSVAEMGDVIFNEQGKAIRMLGIVQDITERKEAEEALRASVERYRSHIEVTGQLGWVAKADGEIEEDIPRWRQFTGQSEDEARGWGWLEALHPDDRERSVQAWREAVETRSTYEVEYRIRRHDGVYRHFLVRGVPVIDDGGSIREWVGTCIDVTEHKNAQAHQQLAGQVLKCLNRESADADLIPDVLAIIRQATGLDALAIRQREEVDFPYLEVNGFPEDFVRTETYLCCRDEVGGPVFDEAGRPIIECMCGHVLSGRADPALPFFTEGGSFWTNSTTDLLANVPAELIQIPMRDSCKQAGYESVALIPLRSGDEIVGLLQLNDTRRGCFTDDMIRFFEEIGASIGIGMSRIRTEQKAEILAKFASESPNPILRVASDGRLLYANDSSSHLLAEWCCALGQAVPDYWRQLVEEVYSSGSCRKLDSEVAGKTFSFVVVPVLSADYVNLYVRDITERKQAERELHLRNRIAEVFLTITDDRIYGEVLHILQETLASEYGFFGYIDQAGDLVCPSLTRDIWDQCEIADKTIVFAHETWGDSIWARAITSSKSQLSNTPLQVPEGHVKVDRMLSIPVVYDEKSIGIITLANKSTDYTPGDEALLESIAGFIAPVLNARLQRMRDETEIESLARFPSENPNPVLRIAKDGTVLYANAAGTRLVVSWGCKTGEQTPENWRQYIARILESGKNEALEAFCEDRIFSLILAPVEGAGYANVYGSDVTERRRAEESLGEYRHHLEELVQTRTAELTQANAKLVQEIEERKRLEKEILNISEKEQRRIGRELHDSIGQQFTGIAFMMKVLEQKLTDKLPDEATDAEEIKKLVNQAMDQTRGLAKGLHPVDLDAGSLTAALQELVSATESMFGVHCDLKCDELVPAGDAEMATHLYRITQEAITNAIKHGKARNIRVEFGCTNGEAVLSIENDGHDFPEGFDRRGAGMGLQIMDHRADIIGASLEIGKAPQGGTIVTCSFRST